MAQLNRNSLGLDEIRQAIGEPPLGVHEEITSIVNDTLSTLEDHFDKVVKRPEIVYDLKGTTAGRALGKSENGTKSYIIRVNCDLLYTSHKEEMLRQTIPHEACHIFVYQAWPGSKGHGGEWRACMRVIGLEPTRCHQYETTKARNREKMDRPYIYLCLCDQPEHHLTAIRHRRIMYEGKKYVCKYCGEELEYFDDESNWQ